MSEATEKIVGEFEKPVSKSNTDWLDQLEIKINSPHPPISYCIKINNVGAIPEGDFTLVKGKKKSGKTHVLIMFTTVMCFGSSFGMVQNQPKKICFFDTEQSKSDGYSLLSSIYKVGGHEKPVDNLHYFSVRTLGKDDRKKFIADAIDRFSPNVIIVDGIRDLLTDFNSLTESQELMQFIKGLTDKGISFIGVLHQNKGEFDKNSRGHLGTEAENYAASIIEASKKDGIFTISEPDSRHSSFPDYQFTIDENGYMQPIKVEPQPTPQELKVRKITDTFRVVFKEKDEWEKSDLINAYFLRIGSGTKKTAYNHLDKALEHNFIIVKDGKYRLSST